MSPCSFPATITITPRVYENYGPHFGVVSEKRPHTVGVGSEKGPHTGQEPGKTEPANKRVKTATEN